MHGARDQWAEPDGLWACLAVGSLIVFAMSTLSSERTISLPSCEDDNWKINIKRLLDKLDYRHPSFLVSGVLPREWGSF